MLRVGLHSWEDVGIQVDDVNDAFVAARDEIEYAKEDAESTYFNESFQTAKTAVDKVLEDFNSILQKLEASEKAKLQRSMGLKMEQLKVNPPIMSIQKWYPPIMKIQQLVANNLLMTPH
jgi:hypothetical protein